MDKLKRFMFTLNDSKLVQKDGSPTMAGWGWLKKTMRDFIKILRDSGKHVILIAHIDEKSDEDRIIKRPKVETKLSDDLVNMVDVVGYMTVIQEGIETKRVIIVDPGNDKYTAKDRTGQLGKIIEPDFTKIVNACQGNEVYSWSSEVAQAKSKKNNKVDKKEETNQADDDEITYEDIKEEQKETPADRAKRLSKIAAKKKSNGNK